MNSRCMIVRAPEIGWREVDGLVFAVEPKTSTMHRLNVTANAIWKFLEKPATIEQITAHVRAEFDGCLGDLEKELEMHVD